MASISRPPGSKNYLITFYYNKKKYRRSLKVSTKRDALALKLIIERKLAEGTIDINYILRNQQQRVTHLAQLVELWKDMTRRRKDIKDATRVGYLYGADLLLKICGDKPLNLINSGYVKYHIRLELGQIYDCIDTIQGRMSIFRNIFYYAVDNDIIAKNPFFKMVPDIKPGKPVFFRKKEIETYVEYWLDPKRRKWHQTYFITILNTGLRMTPHFDLLWSENIFLDEKMIKFPGKGRYEGIERVVPLNDVALREFSSAQRKLGEDKVFWQVKNTSAVNSAWKRFKEKTGFPHRFHDIRANHASQMIMAGDSLEKVMEVHGWVNYKTYRRYKSLSKKYLMENRNIVNWG